MLGRLEELDPLLGQFHLRTLVPLQEPGAQLIFKAPQSLAYNRLGASKGVCRADELPFVRYRYERLQRRRIKHLFLIPIREYKIHHMPFIDIKNNVISTTRRRREAWQIWSDSTGKMHWGWTPRLPTTSA
jgi:hypothetical protein